MAGRQCFHCKQWIEEGQAHDCWTTTEAALTDDLSENLREAWERLRETAVELGEQRIYASHHSIMFSRKACYFFVRPKRKVLELCVFLGRRLRAPQVRTAVKTSKFKVGHIIHIVHRDEVEAPITDWIREAYQLPDVLAEKASRRPLRPRRSRKSRRTTARKAGTHKAGTRSKAPRSKTMRSTATSARTGTTRKKR